MFISLFCIWYLILHLYSKFQADKRTLTLVMKTQEITSNSSVHNSFNTLYIPPTNGEMINENSIKKYVTARSHDLLSVFQHCLEGWRKTTKNPQARIASLSQDLNLDCSTQTLVLPTWLWHPANVKTVWMQICPVHYPIMTIIIIFSTPLYVNYKCTRRDIELHTSGVPVLNNVIVPYNAVCTSSIPIYINQPEIINAIELKAQSWHLITSLARREWNLALTISNQTLNFNLRLHLWHSQCHWNPKQPRWCTGWPTGTCHLLNG